MMSLKKQSGDVTNTILYFVHITTCLIT